ncbi:MAG: hypothetical protein GH150_00915 [Hadesarchaea archaeon]|nr:hypothetical protein [Hadesarchaea archaeon]
MEEEIKSKISVELTGILERVEAIEQILELKAGAQDARLQVLKAIHIAGKVVPYKKFWEIGEKYGYDRRGLGGLFAWKGRGALLTYVAGDKVALTPEGEELLKRHDLAD